MDSPGRFAVDVDVVDDARIGFEVPKASLDGVHNGRINRTQKCGGF